MGAAGTSIRTLNETSPLFARPLMLTGFADHLIRIRQPFWEGPASKGDSFFKAYENFDALHFMDKVGTQIALRWPKM